MSCLDPANSYASSLCRHCVHSLKLRRRVPQRCLRASSKPANTSSAINNQNPTEGSHLISGSERVKFHRRPVLPHLQAEPPEVLLAPVYAVPTLPVKHRDAKASHLPTLLPNCSKEPHGRWASKQCIVTPRRRQIHTHLTTPSRRLQQV
ncbi:hypothetical protein GQ600_960 [Phytophthora cactorum]|nr:hypothetical protein GQ600_960 [Phytophthora cactorum]